MAFGTAVPRCFEEMLFKMLLPTFWLGPSGSRCARCSHLSSSQKHISTTWCICVRAVGGFEAVISSPCERQSGPQIHLFSDLASLASCSIFKNNRIYTWDSRNFHPVCCVCPVRPISPISAFY